MHRHDPDLIMSLAEDRLPVSERAAVERELSACAECLADLTAQRTALAFVRTAPTPTMSRAEREAMRDHLRAELRLVDETASPSPEPLARARWWRPVAGLSAAAAVLLALVLVAPALDFLSPSSSDEAGDLTGALSELTTEAQADQNRTAASELAPVAGLDAAGGEEDGGATTTAPTAPPTTVVASGELFLAYVDEVPSDLERSLDELRSIVIEEGGDLSSVRRQLSTTTETLVGVSVEQSERCASSVSALTSAEIVDRLPIALFETSSGPGLVVAYVTSDSAESFVVLHRTDDCAPILSAPPQLP